MTLSDYLDGGPIDPPDVEQDVDAIIAERAEECAQSPADDEMDRADLHDAMGRAPDAREWHAFTCQRRAAMLRIEDEQASEAAMWADVIAAE